ncbi:MAG TPA: 2-oxoacid:acceptor oxidoreductase family protein, partial [Methanomicrobiales archaeon]|nr:2-oxoacid:acceptor oxidoreductase family protein [Methanomicrobiales archaeon]
ADVNVFAGMKKGGIAIVNTAKPGAWNIPEGVRLIAVDATGIALETLGVPITNTTLMGAFAAASGEITMEAMEHAIRHRFPEEIAKKNIEAARRAYQLVKGAVS